jgi:hypothetical protein
MAARLITFLDTLWVMAPEVPSQWCVPPEFSGFRFYNRIFVNVRLKIHEIYRCPRTLPTLTSEKIFPPLPASLRMKEDTLRRFISRSPLMNQDSGPRTSMYANIGWTKFFLDLGSKSDPIA